MVIVKTWLGFLADDRRPLAGAAAAARVDWLLRQGSGGGEEIFEAANLIALTVFRAGEVELARTICQQEIEYALRGRFPYTPDRLLWAVQPQINLFRIDGYGADPDRGLAGVAMLAPLAQGRGVELPDLTLSDAAVAKLDLDGVPIRRLARNVHITDTCKFLYRHQRWDALAETARDICALYPEATTYGPHHAAEVPWLLAPADQQAPDRAGLATGTKGRRLTYLQLVHHTGHLVSLGHDEQARGLADFLSRHDILTGVFTSPATPLRWLAYLADNLLRTNAHHLAEPILRRVLADPESAVDPFLLRGTADRLSLPVPVEPTVALEHLRSLVDRVLDRLQT